MSLSTKLPVVSRDRRAGSRRYTPSPRRGNIHRRVIEVHAMGEFRVGRILAQRRGRIRQAERGVPPVTMYSYAGPVIVAPPGPCRDRQFGRRGQAVRGPRLFSHPLHTVV